MAAKQYKIDMFDFFSSKEWNFLLRGFWWNTAVHKIEIAEEMNKNENFNFYAVKKKRWFFLMNQFFN